MRTRHRSRVRPRGAPRPEGSRRCRCPRASFGRRTRASVRAGRPSPELRWAEVDLIPFDIPWPTLVLGAAEAATLFVSLRTSERISTRPPTGPHTLGGRLAPPELALHGRGVAHTAAPPRQRQNTPRIVGPSGRHAAGGPPARRGAARAPSPTQSRGHSAHRDRAPGRPGGGRSASSTPGGRGRGPA